MPIHNQLAVLLDQHSKIVQTWLDWLEVLFQTRFKPVLVWVSHFIESSCNPILCWVGIMFFNDQLQMGVGWVPYLIESCFKTVLGGYQHFFFLVRICALWWQLFLEFFCRFPVQFYQICCFFDICSHFSTSPKWRKIKKIPGGYHI